MFTRTYQLLLFLALALSSPSAGNLIAQELEIHCINIGQGDCTVIVSPSGKTMMIDAGPPFNASEEHLWEYLDVTLDIDSLDYFIATHYHQDHTGGIAAMVDSGLFIDTVFDRGWKYCTQQYEDQYLPAVNGRRYEIQDGREISLGGGVLVKIVSVNGNGQLTSPHIHEGNPCPPEEGNGNHENDFSIAMVVEYGEFEFFVGGDLSGSDTSPYTDIESSVAQEVGNVDVYQVNHHGSRFSTNDSLLGVLHPCVSIISASGTTHPHASVVSRLSAVSTVYQTHVNGDVVIITGGETIFTVNGDVYPVPCAAALDETESGVQLGFMLHQNYPNPFNSSTAITFWLSKTSTPKLDILNVAGQIVRSYSVGALPSGLHSFHWDGVNSERQPVASGVYFSRLTAGEGYATRKMLLVK